MGLTFILSVVGCILMFLCIWDFTITMPTESLIQLFPGTEGCSGWNDFGYNRKQQIRQCLLILIGSVIAAWLFTMI